jgi:divalent metal cation (Fe/Co/Zn/Cd) transporter
LLISLPFVLGHGKFESLGALGISSMLLVTSGGIAWHAFEVLQVYYFSLSKSVRAELYV